MENTAFDRARAWLQQGRPDRAVPELLKSLGEDPGNANTHAVLALCYLQLDRPDEALEEARRAVGHGPDQALSHYALAAAHDSRDELREARAAVEEALRLDPEDPDAWTLLSQIALGQRRFAEARDHADQALELNPEHINALNLRARALTLLGEGEGAADVLGTALAQDPENAFTHANLGWSLLHRGEPREAEKHFLEALRLEPGFEAARGGLIESIKSRNVFYRWMLGFFLWMGTLQQGVAWAVLIGIWLVPRILRSIARSNPGFAPWALAITLPLIAFAYLTWIVGPLGDLFLFLHPVGRHALTRHERQRAVGVGVCLLLFAVFLTVALVVPAPALILPAIVSLGYVIPWTFAAGEKRSLLRWAIAALMLACGVGGSYLLPALQLPDAGRLALSVFSLGVFGLSLFSSQQSLRSRAQ